MYPNVGNLFNFRFNEDYFIQGAMIGNGDNDRIILKLDNGSLFCISVGFYMRVADRNDEIRDTRLEVIKHIELIKRVKSLLKLAAYREELRTLPEFKPLELIIYGGGTLIVKDPEIYKLVRFEYSPNVSYGYFSVVPNCTLVVESNKEVIEGLFGKFYTRAYELYKDNYCTYREQHSVSFIVERGFEGKSRRILM